MKKRGKIDMTRGPIMPSIMLCFPVSFGFGLLCMLAYYAFSPSWKALMERGL